MRAPGESRTHDTGFADQRLATWLRVLRKWSGWRDSNSAPTGWQPAVPPTTLHPLFLHRASRLSRNPGDCGRGRRADHTTASARRLRIFSASKHEQNIAHEPKPVIFMCRFFMCRRTRRLFRTLPQLAAAGWPLTGSSWTIQRKVAVSYLRHVPTPTARMNGTPGVNGPSLCFRRHVMHPEWLRPRAAFIDPPRSRVFR